MRPESHKSQSGAPSTWVSAKRALACAKPRFRTLEQVIEIGDLLLQQTVFEGVERDALIAIAFFMEAKHSEAGECILSKGQPMEHWCLLLDGSALVTRYSAARGGEQSTATLGPNDSWSEAALLHSTHPRRSSMTVIAGQQGCITLRMRYTDYDAINDPRQSLQLLPQEGAQGPLAVPELTQTQRRAASLALLCCCLRRLAGARPPEERTPEEASELEPFISSLPAYRTYPSELVASLAAACRVLSLPPGGIIYEASTLADAQVTVLRGEVQLRKLGGGEDGDGEGAGAGGGSGTTGSSASGGAAAAVGAGATGSSTMSGGAGAGGGGGPVPPAGQQPLADSGDANSRLSIRARLKREREARKQMQRQLDEYVSRMDASEPSAASAPPQRPKESAREGPGASGSNSSGPVDWTRIFMQKAMRTAEPVWKALHPADNTRRPQQSSGGGAGDNPADEGPITEVAQLLGPAAAKAYYRGLQTQGYSDTDSPDAAGSGGGGGGGGGAGAGAGRLAEWAANINGASGAGGGPGSRSDSITTRDRWRRWVFSVDGPETEKQRTLRNMAMRASRIFRDQNARSRRSMFDADEMEELYGPLLGTLTRGSPVGELSTVNLHSTMRKESAVAGPSGCELLMVDWEAFLQGVLAARVGLLGRAAPFLAAMPRDRLSRLAELCLCLTVDAGTLLARQGGPLESVVVVQTGELQLLHEPSAPPSHHRIATIKGHAVNRSRNGRLYTVPLLASLTNAQVPGMAPLSASGTPGGHGASGAGAIRPGPPPSLPSFTSSGSAAAEVTLQGLPMGEVGAGAILGENVLGIMPHGAHAPTGSAGAAGAAGSAVPQGAHGHSDPGRGFGPPGGGVSGGGAAAGIAAAAPGPGADGHSHGQGHGHTAGGGGGGGGNGTMSGAAEGAPAAAGSPWPAAATEGPKWPATVLAAKTSVLLVVPKSVLYLAEFDAMRPQLLRFAAERKQWLAKRVEAAYREAAAPATQPAVFASAAVAAAAAAGDSGPPSPSSAQQHQQTPVVAPSLRRSVLSGTAAAAAAAASGPGARASVDGGAGTEPFRRAASGDLIGGGGNASDSADGGAGTSGPSSPHGFGLTRRRSVESFSRYSSPSTTSIPGGPLTPLGAYGTGGGGGFGTPGGVSLSGVSITGGAPRLNNKWDFLDNPTTGTPPALGAEASNPWMAPPVFAAGTSFSRSVVALPPAFRDTAASATAGAGAGPAGVYGGGGSFTNAASPYGSMPLRRPSSGMLRAFREAAAAGAGSGAAPSSYEAAGLTPVQQALLEVGFDPGLAAGEPYTPDAASARRSPGAAAPAGMLPALGPAAVSPAVGHAAMPPPRLTINPHARASASAGPSPVASVDFDALRSSNTSITAPFRSPNALTPTPRRSFSGTPGGLIPCTSAPPTSLLDQSFANAVLAGGGRSCSPGATAAPGVGQPTATAYISPTMQPQQAPGGGAAAFPAVLTPSSNKRASYSGYTTAVAPMLLSPGTPGRRPPDLETGLAGAPAAAAAGGGGPVALSPRHAGGPAVAAVVAQMHPLGSRVPGLAAVEMFEAAAAVSGGAPASPGGAAPVGGYNRSARSSYTSGGGPRMSSGVDTAWLLSSDGTRRGGVGRGGAAAAAAAAAAANARSAAAAMYSDGVALEVAEAEEEVALARSLVPKNQAGNFMVREGLSSTPTKPAVRRIANCF